MAVTIEHKIPGEPWDDSQGMAIALRDVGANIPTLEQYGTSGLWYPNFDAIGDKLVFSLQVPHGYKVGSDVVFHVHWKSSTSSANTVKWQITYQWVDVNDDFNSTTSTTDTVEDTPIINQHQIAAFSTISGTGMGISSALNGNLSRITNAATDYTGEVYLIFADFHFQRDTVGSRTALAK